jgi:hypothetical protein
MIELHWHKVGGGHDCYIQCTGHSRYWKDTNRSCEGCPIKFKCYSCKEILVLDTLEEYNNAVNFIQGRDYEVY